MMLIMCKLNKNIKRFVEPNVKQDDYNEYIKIYHKTYDYEITRTVDNNFKIIF